MNDLPSHAVISFALDEQDARDLYRERKLQCCGCGRANPQVEAWVLPGLCAHCALHVRSVTAAAPREQAQPQLSLVPYPD